MALIAVCSFFSVKLLFVVVGFVFCLFFYFVGLFVFRDLNMSI